jgi:hypothetical protein
MQKDGLSAMSRNNANKLAAVSEVTRGCLQCLSIMKIHLLTLLLQTTMLIAEIVSIVTKY